MEKLTIKNDNILEMSLSNFLLILDMLRALDEMHGEGGQTSDATDFIDQEINFIEKELKKHNIKIEYDCGSRTCMYGCPIEIG